MPRNYIVWFKFYIRVQYYEINLENNGINFGCNS